MQEDELRKQIESFYVKIRAGRDPKTGELHLEPTDFYDQMLTLIKQYSKDYADRDRQDKLIDFIQDPENINKAIEGSMKERQRVLDTPIVDNIEHKLYEKLRSILVFREDDLDQRIYADALNDLVSAVQEQQKALITRLLEQAEDYQIAYKGGDKVFFNAEPIKAVPVEVIKNEVA